MNYCLSLDLDFFKDPVVLKLEKEGLTLKYLELLTLSLRYSNTTRSPTSFGLLTDKEISSELKIDIEEYKNMITIFEKLKIISTKNDKIYIKNINNYKLFPSPAAIRMRRCRVNKLTLKAINHATTTSSEDIKPTTISELSISSPPDLNIYENQSEYVEGLIVFWNNCKNLPKCRYMSVNLPNIAQVANKIKILGINECKYAIQALDRNYISIDAKFKPNSFHRFFLSSVDNWLESANPDKRYQEDSTLMEDVISGKYG